MTRVQIVEASLLSPFRRGESIDSDSLSSERIGRFLRVVSACIGRKGLALGKGEK